MRTIAALLLSIPCVVLAYDANGVRLGGSEEQVKKAFPGIHCKALEWKSDAAERRCDDGRVSFGGIPGRITFYFKAGVIEAFDLRFDTRELERMKTLLRGRYGAPLGETVETISRKGREDRQVYKMRWEKGPERAVLSAQLERKRANLEVWRGSFAEEIYRVK